MRGSLGDFNNNNGQSIADPEIVFEIEDERWRDSYRQIIDNVRGLVDKVNKLEQRVQIFRRVMIRQRQVYQSVIVEYIDTPVISVSIDGSSVVSSLTLPEQTVRQTRIIALPETAIGFVPQFSSTNTSDIRHQFVGIPEDQV